MRLFETTDSRPTSIALMILRVIMGATFVAHGAQKLFVWGLAGVSAGFAQMGIPAAGLMGPFIAFLEFFGGIALVMGLLTRLASTGLALNMAGAILLVHLANGFFLPNGSEYALALLGTMAGLAIAGAGRYSLDALIARRRGATEEPARSIPARSGSRRVA